MDVNVKVVDGGLSTELERAGHSINDDPLWSARLLLTQPSAIKSVHKSFLEHGADIIETATYQASIEGFAKHAGLTKEESLQLMRTAVRLAQEAVQEFWTHNSDKKLHKPMIAGSIGPYGACQHDASEYHGNYVDTMSMKELQDWHRPRLEAVINAGVDMLAVETIPAQKEAQAIVELLADEFPGVEASLAFSCKDEVHTCHGEKFSDAVSSVSHCKQLLAIGANCCAPRFITPLFKHARENYGGPFVTYPNSGEEWQNNEWCGQGEKMNFNHLIPEWLDLGVRYVGGCCRTTPQDIQAISDVVRMYPMKGGGKT